MKQPLTSEQVDYLRRRYIKLGDGGSYMSPRLFYDSLKREGKYKFTLDQIKSFVSSRYFYTLQRQVNRRFRRLPVISSHIGYLHEIDVMFLTGYDPDSKLNYVIGMIDTFSRLCYFEPVSAIKERYYVPAVSKLIERFGNVSRLRGDRGKEMQSEGFKALMKEKNIKFYEADNKDTKACLIERRFKDLRSILGKIMTKNRSLSWAKYLPDIEQTLNNTMNTATLKVPSQVTDDDEYEIWYNLRYRNYHKRKHIATDFSHEINTPVRIVGFRHKFMRASDATFTNQYYLISGRTIKNDIEIYYLKDLNNKPLDSFYYAAEIQSIQIPDDEHYEHHIEKVISKNKQNEYLVQYVGWDIDHAQWMEASEVKKYPYGEEALEKFQANSNDTEKKKAKRRRKR